MLFFERIVFSTFLVFTFLENMARKKMITATTTDLSFDFHLNISSDPVRNLFPLANRDGDPDRFPRCWIRTKWEHLYWDDAFPASDSLDLFA